MKSNSSYYTANQRLQQFIANHILDYDKKRNFDYGVENRNNTSNLSMFVTHRVLLEYDIIGSVLNKYRIEQVEKYIQEVFWRVYWKGWLENRPSVWNDFVRDCSNIKTNIGYEKAINGQSKINCFNEWVNELKEHNYLHNHTRMWFASIWIFTLKLPWQLGAKFFYEHLYDGDSASNTLSWRWVAGLQTRGKNYLAKSWNIKKFTNNRFCEEKLNEVEQPLDDFKEYKLEENKFKKSFSKKNSKLIIFENDLSIQGRDELYKSYENIFFIILKNDKRKLPLNKKVYDFKLSLCQNFCNHFSNCHIIEKDEENFLKDIGECDVIYPFVGENLDFVLNSCDTGLLNFVIREEDIYCKQFSKKGFFNFKKNINRIIDHLKLTK